MGPGGPKMGHMAGHMAGQWPRTDSLRPHGRPVAKNRLQLPSNRNTADHSYLIDCVFYFMLS